MGEPYGHSIVEAMSIGTPCICHDSGGPAEIIENEVDGLLVKELTAKAFAEGASHFFKWIEGTSCQPRYFVML